MKMMDGGRGGRRSWPALFAKWLIPVLVMLAATEVLLRLCPFEALEFVNASRRVTRYHPRWNVDGVPGGRAWFTLHAADGELFYNFLVTMGGDGFRTYDRPLDYSLFRSASNAVGESSSDIAFVHAIGDSYTMGWGVDYTSSYPAILERLLPANYRVLNLGLHGFGTVAATEKSMSLWNKYPAREAIYLFCPNDFDDDRGLAGFSGRSVLNHAGHRLFNGLRRWSYVANLYHAVKVWSGFRSALARTETSGRADRAPTAPPEMMPVVKDLPDEPPSPEAERSLVQLGKYADFVEQRGGRVAVFTTAATPEANAVSSFCRRRGVAAYVLDPSPAATLVREGHFNYEGNQALAELVLERILSDSRPEAR
jgi:hypothetical protein